MRRSRIAVSAVLLGAAALPSAASAQVIELGQTATPLAAPTCPTGVSKANCTIILTKTTAIETLADKMLYPTTVTQPGYLVAWSVGLAKLAKADITGLNTRYGGPATLAVSVLRPGKNRRYTLRAESPLQKVAPWFGTVVQFPLMTALPVQAGDVVGLTVSTWAPVLSIGLPRKSFQYRASRASGCTAFDMQTAQLQIGGTAQYLCFYVGTRVEYTATEVTSPAVPKNPAATGTGTGTTTTPATPKPAHHADRVRRRVRRHR